MNAATLLCLALVAAAAMAYGIAHAARRTTRPARRSAMPSSSMAADMTQQDKLEMFRHNLAMGIMNAHKHGLS